MNVPLVPGLINSPQGVAVSGSNLFVMFALTGTIGEYDANTGAAINTSLVSGLSHSLTGIAVSGTNLFVAHDSVVGEYDANTGAVINASLVTGLNATGLAIVGNDLFVDNSGVGVGEYTLGSTPGTLTASNPSLITGQNATSWGIAVVAQTQDLPPVTPPVIPPVTTPEPSTWALLLGGLGLLFFWHRRKLNA